MSVLGACGCWLGILFNHQYWCIPDGARWYTHYASHSTQTYMYTDTQSGSYERIHMFIWSMYIYIYGLALLQTYSMFAYRGYCNVQKYNCCVCFLCVAVGSNSHNNGNPAGDGQAGDAGEGETGTECYLYYT